MSPLKQSPNSSYYAYAVAILSSLFLVVSLVTLASKASSIQLLKDDFTRGSIPPLSTEFPQNPLPIRPYPKKLAANAPGLVLTTACLCLVLATVLVICTVKGIRQCRPVKLFRSQWKALFSSLILVTLLNLTIIIIMIVQVAQSPHFSLRTLKLDLDSGYILLQGGVYELGVWACETKNLSAFEFWNHVHQCGLFTALRVSMTLQFLIAASVSALIWWDVRTGRGRSFKLRQLVFNDDGDVELDS